MDTIFYLIEIYLLGLIIFYSIRFLLKKIKSKFKKKLKPV